MLLETNGNAGKTDGATIWSSLLKDVSTKRSQVLPENKQLVVLGDQMCGKTSLVARIKDAEEIQKSYGLEYEVMEVKDEFRDDRAQLGVYIVDGDAVFMSLMRHELNLTTLKDFTAIITVSMDKPWLIMEQLQFWLNNLASYIESLNIPIEDLNQLRNNIERQFREYTEEEDAVVTSAVITDSSTTMRAPKRQLNPALSALMGEQEVKNDHAIETEVPEAEVDPLLLPLTEGALIKNLGIPIIIVVTKTDCMADLERDQQMTDEHFDFIQMHVRRLCLSYGATLFYVSAKDNRNCALLRQYIKHRIYGFPFNQTAYVVEKECIFVPSGWDSEKKIAILQHNLVNIRSGDAYNDVVPMPKQKKPVHREPEIVVPDEQEFLTQLLKTVNTGTLPTSTVLQSNEALSGDPVNFGRQIGGVPSSAQRGAVLRSKNDDTPGSAGNAQVSGSVGTPKDTVLVNFFNNLLNKRPAAGVSPERSGQKRAESETSTPVKCASGTDGQSPAESSNPAQ